MLDPLFIPYPGGAEKVVFEVGKRLAKKGHEVTVLTSKIPNTASREEMEGMHIIRTPSLYFEKLPFSFLPPPFTLSPALNYDILKQDADIFHMHNRFWYYLGTLANLKLIKRKKLMLTLHNARAIGIDQQTDVSAGFYDDIWAKRIMENCDKMTAVSDWTKRVTVPEKLWPKCEVILNGIDTTKFYPREKKLSQHIRDKFNIGDDELILTNARIIKQKGYEYLISAFSELVHDKEHRKAKLLIIGKGPLKEWVLEKAKALGVGDSVIITTGIPEQELPLYYNAADIFALASIWEPCAVVLFEALASGTPVVAFGAGGIPEIVDEECGRVVPPRDSHALYLKMKELLEDKKLRDKLSIRARKKAEANFTWDIAAEKFEKVYKSLF
jgi:glycogen synthase